MDASSQKLLRDLDSLGPRTKEKARRDPRAGRVLLEAWNSGRDGEVVNPDLGDLAGELLARFDDDSMTVFEACVGLS